MSPGAAITRREFLAGAAALAAAGAASSAASEKGQEPYVFSEKVPDTFSDAAAQAVPAPGKSRVVVIRHEALAVEGQGPPPERVRELLDEAARTLAGDAKAADAWARWLKPSDCLGIKVNCLGYPTRPAVGLAIAAAAGAAGLAPERMIIWDRTTDELRRAGYEPRGSGSGVRCFGTDALAQRGSGGYGPEILTSGAIGSLYSRIVADEATALVSACILKDHNLAGLTCAMKNFYGAIHNPNKYHDNGCDPFIADVCAGPPVRDRLRLVVCDALRPQYHGGPSHRPQWQWPYGGLIVSTDPVALDRVALEILARKRAAAGAKPLEAENRPVRYLASAQARGLGTADLAGIEVLSIGKPWNEI